MFLFRLHKSHVTTILNNKDLKQVIGRLLITSYLTRYNINEITGSKIIT